MQFVRENIGHEAFHMLTAVENVLKLNYVVDACAFIPFPRYTRTYIIRTICTNICISCQISNLQSRANRSECFRCCKCILYFWLLLAFTWCAKWLVQKILSTIKNNLKKLRLFGCLFVVFFVLVLHWIIIMVVEMAIMQ